MIVKREINWAGRVLSIETGYLANQATGSVTVRYGDTVVLCTAVSNKKPNTETSFFPLTVNYIEKAYAVGKIPGGFIKREGRPSEKETLISRLIDRPIRPLFHKDFQNETQVICTVLSFDGKNDADIISIIGASAALTISGIPFLGPIAASKIGYKDGNFILNPEIGTDTDLDLVIAGSIDGVLMVESGAQEFSEHEMLNALKYGHASFIPVIDMIIDLAEEAANSPWSIATNKNESEISTVCDKIKDKYIEDIRAAYKGHSKHDRNNSLSDVKQNVISQFIENHDESIIVKAFDDVCYYFVREQILSTKKRIDGRETKEIRPIKTDVSTLPKVHGSALFMRGETQALVVTTIGTSQDEQFVDGLSGEYKERFMLHYNFPPFSVGEVGRLGTPGRREVGHGKLAQRALIPVLPSKEECPYSIRIVSEILSCNGSSSMATVCGASMSMMDAGVKLKTAVAGIAMGLIIEEDKYEILSDIMGEEDHLGDMDFKVAGTINGITALQMDIKVTSVTFEIMEKALHQAKEGRMHILKEMSKTLEHSREELSENAPKISFFNIPKDKIREVIGSGGKVIREIIETTGAKIDIDDDGNVTVAAADSASLDSAICMIQSIALDPVDGTIYSGKVVKIMDFGAFINFYGARDGLVHVSEIMDKRVENVSDVLNEGDIVRVKFLGYDNKGRAKLTMKFKEEI